MSRKKTKALPTLDQFVCDDHGKVKRGALRAVAEHLGVRKGTVNYWRSGKWKPGRDTQKRIDAMIEDGTLDLSPRYENCGKGKRRPAKKVV